jgi:hypothetical protein
MTMTTNEADDDAWAYTLLWLIDDLADAKREDPEMVPYHEARIKMHYLAYPVGISTA